MKAESKFISISLLSIFSNVYHLKFVNLNICRSFENFGKTSKLKFVQKISALTGNSTF